MAQKTWWLEGEPDTAFEPRDEKFRAAAAAARAASAAALPAGDSSSSSASGSSGSISSPLSLSSSVSSGHGGNGAGDYSASTLAWALEAAREELTARLLRCPDLVKALLTTTATGPSTNADGSAAVDAAPTGPSSEAAGTEPPADANVHASSPLSLNSPASRVVVQQLLEALLPALLSAADGRIDHKAWAQAKALAQDQGGETASSPSPVVLRLPAALHRAAAAAVAAAVPTPSPQKAFAAAAAVAAGTFQEDEPLEVSLARCRCLEELAHLLVLLLGNGVSAATELASMWNAQGERLAAKATRATASSSGSGGGFGSGGASLMGGPSGLFGRSSGGGGFGFGGGGSSNHTKSNSSNLMGVAPPLAPGDLVRLCDDRRVASKLHRLCGRAADSPNGIGLHEAMARELGQCTRVVGVKRLKATNEVR